MNKKFSEEIKHFCPLNQKISKHPPKIYDFIGLGGNMSLIDPSIITYCEMACPSRRFSEKIDFETTIFNKDELRILEFPVPKKGASLLYLLNLEVNDIKVMTVPKISSSEVFGLVGGYLGLFIGVSVITVVELLELLLDIVLAKCRRSGSPTLTKVADSQSFHANQQ